MIAEQENLTKELTPEGFIFEVGYANYLRTNGFTIEGISEVDTIQSESDPEKKYLVCKIHTYDKPKDDPDLDYVADECTVWACTCWSWRSNSADLEDQKPSQCKGCKHCRQWKE